MNLPIDFNIMPLLNGGITIALLLFAAVFIAGVFGFAAYIYYREFHRYKQFKFVYWRKDPLSQAPIEQIDDAGIFTDKKTGVKGLWLRKNRGVVFTPDKIPWIHSGKSKIIYALQVGLKNFIFIKPTIEDNQIKFNLGEEDLNWGIYEYRNSQKLLTEEPAWKQWLPYVGLFFVGFIFLFVVVLVIKKFDVMAEVAQAFKEAAMVLKNVK